MVVVAFTLLLTVCLGHGPVGITHWENSGNNCHTENWPRPNEEFGMYPGKGAAIGLPNGHFGISYWPTGCGDRHTCHSPKFEYCSHAGTYKQSNCGDHMCVFRYHRDGSSAHRHQTVVITDVCPSNHPDRGIKTDTPETPDCCGQRLTKESIDHCNCVIGYKGVRGADISYDAWQWLGGGGNFLVHYYEGSCPSTADMTEEQLLMMEQLKNETIAHMTELGLTAEEYWVDTLPKVEFKCEREHEGEACCCKNDGAHPDCECTQDATACPSEICIHSAQEPFASNIDVLVV